MRKLKLFTMLLFVCGVTKSQIYTPTNPTTYGSNNLRLKATTVQHIPVSSDTLLNTNDTSAQIRVINGRLRYHYGYWKYLADSLDIAQKPTYQDVRDIVSDSLVNKTDTTKTKADSNWISQYAKMKLKSWQAKSAVLADYKKSGNTTTSVTPMVIVNGDSVSFDWLYAWFNAIWQALGLGGQYGGFTQNGVTETLAGGTARVGVPVLISSLTRSGTTATATSANHGLSNGQTVTISGANASDYNIVTTVSNVTTNTFDYTVSGSPATPDPSGAIYFTRAADFSKWLTGIYINVPTGGTFTTIRNNNAILLTDTFKTYRIYYVKESGAGDFKVQTSTDNSTYTDVSGYTSISCSSPASDSLGVIDVPIANLLNPYIRIVGVSGNCKIIGTGWQNVQGGRLSNLYAYGGIKIKDQATTPEHIWAAALQADKPDVFVSSFKDDAEPALANGLQIIQTYINRYAPQCATIYSLIYTGLGDSTPATYPTQNITVRQWFDTTTVAGEKYLFDQYSLLGYYNDAAFKGCFDAAAVPAISSITYSSGVATVTTATAHGLSTGNWVRVNEVVPYQYNGVFQVTSTGSTTFTYAPLSAPSTAGVGGVSARLDVTHASAAGRQVLGVGFNRDFQMLTGLNTDYPFQISNQNLKNTSALLTTGGTMTGTLNGVNQNFTGTGTIDTVTVNQVNAGKINANNQIISSVSGAGSSGGFLVSSNNPAIALQSIGSGSNEKIWDFTAATTSFQVRAFNDANNSSSIALQFTRSGTTITAAAINAAATTFSGTIAATTQTLSTSNSSFATQQQITNTSSSANALAGTSYTVNGVNIGTIFSTPSNYGNTAQRSLAAYGSSGTNRVAIIANANSSGAAQDVIIKTRGDEANDRLTVKGATGNVLVGSNTDSLKNRLFQVKGTAYADSVIGGVVSVLGGTSSQFLKADGSVDATDYLPKTITTTGDIIYSSSGSTAARLPIGANNQVLKVTSGVPGWGDMPFVIAQGSVLASTGTVSVATVNAGSSDASVMAMVHLKIASNTGTMSVQVNYTDPDNVFQTQVMYPIGTTSQTVSTTGHVYYSALGEIRCKASTQITIQASIDSGTATYDAYGTLVKVR